MYSEINKDKYSNINFIEFLDISSRYLNARRSKEEIKKQFQLLDNSNNGKISIGSLKQLCIELQENIDDTSLDLIIESGDYDKDGMINFNDFYK